MGKQQRSEEISEQSFISDVYVTTKQAKKYQDSEGAIRCSKSQVDTEVSIEQAKVGMKIHQFVTGDNKTIDLGEYVIGVDDIENDCCKVNLSCYTADVALWDVESPALYEITTELICADSVTDTNVTRYGYRKAVFKKDGFYLNGRKLKIRGLNRNQRRRIKS